MKLKKILLFFLLLFSLTLIAVLFVSVSSVQRNSKISFEKLKELYLRSTFEIYKEEITGNLLLEKRENLKALINEISHQRKVNIYLKTPNIDMHTGDSIDWRTGIEFLVQSGPKNIGSLVMGLQKEGVIANQKAELPFFIGIQVVLLIFVGIIFFRQINQKIAKPLSQLYEATISGKILEFELSKNGVKELVSLDASLKEMCIRLNKQAYLESFVQISSQVSHDIQSPLSALRMIINQLENIPEQQRIYIRSSVQRISDITNQLLAKNKAMLSENKSSLKTNVDFNDEGMKGNVELLSPIVDQIVSEKRIQYRELQGVDIETNIKGAYGLFAQVNSTELKRVISNLITNAVEALPNSNGKIIVTVKKSTDHNDQMVTDDQVSILVQDNGKGIPKHVLLKLGQEKISYGKESSKVSGSGIGIFHAMTVVKALGGKFEIITKEISNNLESSDNNNLTEQSFAHGTTISLTFPLFPAPKWFVEEVLIKPKSVIISCDDDFSIHGIWRDRMDSIDAEQYQVQHITFTSGHEFSEFVRSKYQSLSENFKNKSTLFLMDYELLNQNKTGLDLIEDLEIGSQSILVTSRYEDVEIRERCEKIGVKIIPKPMSWYVPMRIETTSKEYFDWILLENDSLVTAGWRLEAERRNKKFINFQNPEDLFLNINKFDSQCPFYIDSGLDNGVKGEDIAKVVFEGYGFKEIYLCTGYDPSYFTEPLPWIKEIRGKEPPNENA